MATKIKKAKAELEEIRLAEREIVEALIGNYRTVLKHIDEGRPAQEAPELGIQPDAYDPKLDVDFTPLHEQDLTAVGLGQAA